MGGWNQASAVNGMLTFIDTLRSLPQAIRDAEAQEKLEREASRQAEAVDDGF